MRGEDDNREATVAALDAAIANAAARHLRQHSTLTTGQLIQLLLRDKSILTARSDPGRRKQLERALASERGAQLRIRRIEGDFPPVGHVGRRASSAWRIMSRRQSLVARLRSRTSARDA